MLRGSMPSSAFDARAFTLIELLVVIGIISILVGLTFPAIGMVQRYSHIAGDLSNLRGLSIAHAAYMNVFKDHFVDAGLPHGGIGNVKNSFVQTLRPYYGGVMSVKSPLDNSPHWSQDVGESGTPVGSGASAAYRQTSYGLNNYLSRNYSPMVALGGAGSGVDSMNGIGDPSKIVCFLLMAEEGAFAAADHPHIEEWCPLAATDAPKFASSQVAINAADRQAPTRPSKTNWSFLDGHVATMEFDDVYEDCEHNRFDPTLQ